MLRKKRCHETTLKAAAAESVMNSLAMLFSHSYLSAVTKVTFPTIKLVRTVHVAEYDFLCSGEEFVSRRSTQQWFAAVLLVAVSGFILLHPMPSRAQEELTRKAKSKVAPVYPELAKRMSIAGVVKVQVVVAPNGSVKTTKVVGGHPLLVTAAVDAVKKWRFETAAEETTGVVEFKFDPNANQ
jgi:TonB family protein